MLKIIVNNQELNLGNLKGISLNYNPGLFENDSFEGSYSFPITVDNCPQNDLIFGFQRKINALNKEIVEYPAELWHSGIQLATGIVKATQFTYKKTSCNFYLDNGEIFKKLNQTNLPDNDYGGYKPFVVKQLWDPATDDYVIYPVKNDSFFNETIFENDITEGSNYQNRFVNNNLIFGTLPSIVTPFPLLWRVLQYLFTNSGFNYIDTYFSSGVYRNINIYNTVDAQEHYTSNDIAAVRLNQVDIANHLPDIPTTEFLKAIQAFFNIRFYIQNNTVKVIDRTIIILSTAYDDLTSRLIGTITKTLTGINYNGISLSIVRDSNDTNVSNLPDISDIEVSIATVDPELIANPKPHDAYLLSTGFYLRYISENDYNGADNNYWFWYRYHYNYATAHLNANYCRQMGIYLGDRSFEINANLSCLPEPIFTDGNYNNLLPAYIPKVLQQGNTPLHKEITPFSLRLMQYRGRQNNVEEQTLPHGAYYNGNMELTAWWSYKNRWENYYNWYKEAIKEEYECELQLTASEIKNFDFSKKKLINGNLFFITNIQVQFTRSEVKFAKCTMIKAN